MLTGASSSSRGFQFSKQYLWSPVRTLLFVSWGSRRESHPLLRVFVGRGPVCASKVLEAALYKQFVVRVAFPRAITAALICAAAKCLVPGQLPSPSPFHMLGRV